jgi:hypothetical protein
MVTFGASSGSLPVRTAKMRLRLSPMGSGGLTAALDNIELKWRPDGIVSASDEDDDTVLAYSIASQTPTGMFAIDSSSGQITVALSGDPSSSLDFERKNSYVLEILATDGTSTVNTASEMTKVRININDINESPYYDALPSIYGDIAFYSFAPSDSERIPQLFLPEQSSKAPHTSSLLLGSCKQTGAACQTNRELPGRLVAYDQDDSSTPNGHLRFSITGGDGADLFDLSVEGANTRIHVNSAVAGVCVNQTVACVVKTTPETTLPCTRLVCNSLNFERKTTYSLKIKVSDGHPTLPLSEIREHSVRILDKNEAPTMDDQYRSIEENSALKAQAGDPLPFFDEDIAQAHVFFLRSIVPAPAFEVVTCSGYVAVRDAVLDFESDPVYTLVVRVQDNGIDDSVLKGTPFYNPAPLSTDATVTVAIIDINEPPVFAQDTYARQVKENSGVGSNVGLPITAADPDIRKSEDHPWRVLNYTITSGNAAGLFAVDPSSGQITVNKANLDYETVQGRAGYDPELLAMDRGGLSAKCKVKIQILDVNEPPLVTANTGYIRENEPAGTPVFATMGGAQGNRSVRGTQLFIESADQDDCQKMSYRIIWSELPGIFQVSPTLGPARPGTVGLEMAPGASLSFETLRNNPALENNYQIKMEIMVIDDRVNCQFPPYEPVPFRLHSRSNVSDSTPFSKDTGARWGSANYTVVALDVEEPPVISDAVLYIKENSPLGTPIGQWLRVTDDDNYDGHNIQQLTFRIAKVKRRKWGGKSGLDGNLDYFAVTSNETHSKKIDGFGRLSVVGELDYEKFDQYVVTLEVSDTFASDIKLSTTACTIIINLENCNEPPYRDATIPQPLIEVEENANISHVLAQSFKSVFFDADSPREKGYEASSEFAGEGALTYKVIGGSPHDGAFFKLAEWDTTGMLVVGPRSPIDYEDLQLLSNFQVPLPRPQWFEVIVSVTDSGWDGKGNLSTNASIIVHILNQNEGCTVGDDTRRVPEHTILTQLPSIAGGAGIAATNLGLPLIAKDIDQEKEPSAKLEYHIVSGNTYNSRNGLIEAVFAFSESNLGQIVVNDPGIACDDDLNNANRKNPCLTGQFNDPAVVYKNYALGSTGWAVTNNYTLSVRVVDNGVPRDTQSLWCSAEIFVKVTNVNEKPFFVDPSDESFKTLYFRTSIEENDLGPRGDWKFIVKAQDKEIPAQSLTFNIASLSGELYDESNSPCKPSVRCKCNDPRYLVVVDEPHLSCNVKFEIETSVLKDGAWYEGTVTLKDISPLALDYERITEIFLELTVTDSDPSQQTTTALLQIDITDVNEPPLLDTLTPIVLSVREDERAGTIVVPPEFDKSTFPEVEEPILEPNDRLDVDQDDASIQSGTVFLFLERSRCCRSY